MKFHSLSMLFTLRGPPRPVTAPLNLDMCKWHVPWPMNMTENTPEEEEQEGGGES